MILSLASLLFFFFFGPHFDLMRHFCVSFLLFLSRKGQRRVCKKICNKKNTKKKQTKTNNSWLLLVSRWPTGNDTFQHPLSPSPQCPFLGFCQLSDGVSSCRWQSIYRGVLQRRIINRTIGIYLFFRRSAVTMGWSLYSIAVLCGLLGEFVLHLRHLLCSSSLIWIKTSVKYLTMKVIVSCF